MWKPALAQQFNSDKYLYKPHGMATLIVTAGEQFTMIMTTLSLYAKWMIYENKAKTGGIAFKFGVGQKPSYVLDGTGFESASQTLWVNSPVTLPFLDNKLSWDIMPGASVTRKYGDDEVTVGAFTYSTRLAWYPKSPKLAIVGEVYGAEGAADLDPEYKAGLRWEPTAWANLAFTYGGRFNGDHGSGFEFGVMLFTPPFACVGGCR